MRKIIEILAQGYGFCPQDCTIAPIGSGLINDTYLLTTQGKGTTLSYIAQRINTNVFTEPTLVNQNLSHVCQHLNASQKYPYRAFDLVKTLEGELSLYLDGQVWRVLSFLDNTYSVDRVSSTQQALKGAKAFGQFAAVFEGFDLDNLHEVILDFHNLSLRFYQLDKAMQVNQYGRLSQVSELIACYTENRNFIEELAYWHQVLPKRVTHNDTKISNLLFDKSTDNVCAVIDFDTCMSGLLLFDFGDMVRSGCTTAATESDSLATFNGDFFMAMTKGYLESVGHFITPQEKRSLWFGVKLMPFMLSIRFLTDYLNGDAYFKVDYEQQNLDRAWNQLKLFLDICAKETDFLPLFSAS